MRLFYQLRQKSSTKNIAMSSVAGSLTSLPASRDVLFPKSATLGPHFARPSSTQASMAHTLSSTRHSRTPASPDMSLPLGRKIGAKSAEQEEDDDDESNHNLSPVPTDFCDWCCKYFANSLTKVRCLCQRIYKYSQQSKMSMLEDIQVLPVE